MTRDEQIIQAQNDGQRRIYIGLAVKVAGIFTLCLEPKYWVFGGVVTMGGIVLELFGLMDILFPDEAVKRGNSTP